MFLEHQFFVTTADHTFSHPHSFRPSLQHAMPHGVLAPDCPAAQATDTSSAWRLLSLELLNLGRPWKGSIPFRLSPFPAKDVRLPPNLSPSAFRVCDICNFLNGERGDDFLKLSKTTSVTHRLVSHIYFDPAVYPPPPCGCIFFFCRIQTIEATPTRLDAGCSQYRLTHPDKRSKVRCRPVLPFLLFLFSRPECHCS